MGTPTVLKVNSHKGLRVRGDNLGNAEVTGSIPVSSLKIDKPGDTGKSYSNLCIYWFF